MMDSGQSETLRVLYQINLRNSASRWLSLSEYITMHGPLNAKCQIPSVFLTFGLRTLRIPDVPGQIFIIQYVKQIWRVTSPFSAHTNNTLDTHLQKVTTNTHFCTSTLIPNIPLPIFS
jgi:hypothetical protein